MKIIILLLTVIIVVGVTDNVFAEEDYDLSNHPVYNWVWNENINFSNERYSSPKSSNDYTLAYSLSILKVDFDPTRIYYEKPIAIVYDYCDMDQFAKYPRCR